MGKARILSAQGEGLYSIEILEDRARAESLKQRALERIDEIDSELDDLESDLDQAQQDVDAAANAQNQAIDQHQAQIIASGESDVDLQSPALAVLEAAAARDSIRTRIASLNLERLGRQAWVDRVESLPELRTQEAWCADLTENLSGEVATAEVPGEIGQVIIKPGFHDSASWSPSEDGAMQPALAGTPAGVFYNLAMLPGWQRWRPTFRIATISNINEDLCDIILDAATSSQQGLNVNAQGSYSGVPIYYMDCNGAAFDDGDRVLVAFSGNTEQPMVVGFEQEPKECCVAEPFGKIGPLLETDRDSWWARLYTLRTKHKVCIKSVSCNMISGVGHLAVYKCESRPNVATSLLFSSFVGPGAQTIPLPQNIEVDQGEYVMVGLMCEHEGDGAQGNAGRAAEPEWATLYPVSGAQHTPSIYTTRSGARPSEVLGVSLDVGGASSTQMVDAYPAVGFNLDQ